MKSVSVTKGIVVAGQYGVGKTETLAGLIRSAELARSARHIGAFVAESANIALDAGRYGIGSAATGVSFASVCCPTLADMRQAMDTALKDRAYDLLFFEPPGNMHPPLMAQVALDKGIELEHIIMLVSERDFKEDRHMSTFNTGLEIANIIGITHRLPGLELNKEMTDAIKSCNPDAPVISFGKGGLSYETIQSSAKWTMERFSAAEEFGHSMHSDHYDKTLRVFNPELSYETIINTLSKIAETGLLARAKGSIPKYNKQIDLKGRSLSISEPSVPLSKDRMGYLVCFAKEGTEMPMELIDSISVAPEQRTRQMAENAPIESKFAVFGRLYRESQGKLDSIFANGKVTYTYTPIDDAEKLANEIKNDTGDESAVRMILPLFHGVRLNALTELAKRKPTESPFSGVHISSVLINTSLGSGSAGLDYPRLSDQHQMIKIKAHTIPALFYYSNQLRTDEIKDFPRFEAAVGPYILKAAQIGWDTLSLAQRDHFAALRSKAKENMAKIHKEAGFLALAQAWEAQV